MYSILCFTSCDLKTLFFVSCDSFRMVNSISLMDKNGEDDNSIQLIAF
jgi:hypothetical protein